jgi:hypothetical protein
LIFYYITQFVHKEVLLQYIHDFIEVVVKLDTFFTSPPDGDAADVFAMSFHNVNLVVPYWVL